MLIKRLWEELFLLHITTYTSETDRSRALVKRIRIETDRFRQMEEQEGATRP